MLNSMDNPMCFWAVGEGDTCPNRATHTEREDCEEDGIRFRATCDSCCGASRMDSKRCDDTCKFALLDLHRLKKSLLEEDGDSMVFMAIDSLHANLTGDEVCNDCPSDPSNDTQDKIARALFMTLYGESVTHLDNKPWTWEKANTQVRGHVLKLTKSVMQAMG